MTKNQIEYMKVLESQRANRATEALTASRDKTNRELGLGTLAETSRHNKATEQQQYAVLGESKRHNVATEALGQATLSEQQRHAIATETEQHRANVAKEGLTAQQINLGQSQLAETKRHNKVGEATSIADTTVKSAATVSKEIRSWLNPLSALGRN